MSLVHKPPFIYGHNMSRPFIFTRWWLDKVRQRVGRPYLVHHQRKKTLAWPSGSFLGDTQIFRCKSSITKYLVLNVWPLGSESYRAMIFFLQIYDGHNPDEMEQMSTRESKVIIACLHSNLDIWRLASAYYCFASVGSSHANGKMRWTIMMSVYLDSAFYRLLNATWRPS